MRGIAAAALLMLAACGPTETASAPVPPTPVAEPAGTPAVPAVDAAAPAVPLSEAGLRHEQIYQDCLSQVRPATANEAPPTEGGLYVSQNACPFEGCDLSWLHAREVLTLRAERNDAAPVTAIIAAGEWAWAADSVDVFPLSRGVVVEAQPGLEVCDVVYTVRYGGEGERDLWRRGEIVPWMDGGMTPDDPYTASGIRWDDSAFDDPATLTPDQTARQGWWIQLRHSGGASGWIRDPEADCMGLIDPPDICKDAPKNPPG